MVKEAGFKPWALHGPKGSNISVELETFANLITQECNRLFDAQSDKKTLTHKQIVDKIKKHFDPNDTGL
jgi:hypothetical protein